MRVQLINIFAFGSLSSSKRMTAKFIMTVYPVIASDGSNGSINGSVW